MDTPQMTVVYIPQTSHVLAATTSRTGTPNVALLVGGGLPVRNVITPISGGVYGTPCNGDELVLVPPAALAIATAPLDLATVAAPFAYAVDGTDVLVMPPPFQALPQNNRISFSASNPSQISIVVVLGPPFTFTVDTNYWILIESSVPFQRRILSGTFKAGTALPLIDITAEPGGAVVPLATGTYSALVLVAGWPPDMRTITVP